MKKSKVFCIGLSRTGTSSLSYWLQQHGYQTLHYSKELFANGDQLNAEFAHDPMLPMNYFQRRKYANYWYALRENDIFSILDRHDAFLDNPIPLFYKELSKYYPDSKFVLTLRNIDDWLESMCWMLTHGSANWGWDLVDYEMLQAIYNTVHYQENKLRDVYINHLEDSKRFFEGQEDRLFMFNLTSNDPNYDSLANFLGIKRKRFLGFPHKNLRNPTSFLKRTRHHLKLKFGLR